MLLSFRRLLDTMTIEPQRARQQPEYFVRYTFRLPCDKHSIPRKTSAGSWTVGALSVRPHNVGQGTLHDDTNRSQDAIVARIL